MAVVGRQVDAQFGHSGFAVGQQPLAKSVVDPGLGHHARAVARADACLVGLDQRIERGMSMAETVAEIRRQGGLVYVPHPFDRLHSVPDYEHLLDIVEEIDVLEVFNPRVAVTAFNEEAERFARMGLEIDVRDAECQRVLLEALANQNKQDEADKLKKIFGS